MSDNIDERIVRMEFDNKQFNDGVKETQKNLKSLNESLKFEDSSKSFDNITRAANNVDLSNITKNVGLLQKSFTALGEFSQGIIANIANDVYALGKRVLKAPWNLAKSFSFDQINAGYSKYESNLKSTQTIMAATGKSISEVETEMDKLNWYTDETSYSLSDMVSNIATFTNNGIGLSAATKQMIGIANAAGLAGASTTDATHAMQGFAKAMGRHYMDQMNWSWIRTAHMDTLAVKQDFIDAAETLGYLTKTVVRDGEQIYETTKKSSKAGEEVTATAFETSLGKAKWMTDEVMSLGLESFSKYSEEVYQLVQEGYNTADAMTEVIQNRIKAGAQDADKALDVLAFSSAQIARTFGDAITSVKDAVSTNWMLLFKNIFGNYEESKEMWTAMSTDLWEVFVPPVQNITSAFIKWHSLSEAQITDLRKQYGGVAGTYEDFTTGVTNFFDILAMLADEVHEKFSPLLPTWQTLTKISRNFYNLTVKWKKKLELKQTAEQIEAATETVTKGINNVQDTVEATTTTVKTLAEVANDVIHGDWQNASTRFQALEKAGYSWEAVQNKVNELLGCEKRYEYDASKVDAATGMRIDALNQASESTVSLSSATEDATVKEEKHFSVLENLQSILKLVGQAIGFVKDIGVSLFNAVIKPAASFIGKFGKALLGVLGSGAEKLSNLISKLREANTVQTKIQEFVDKFKEKFQGVIDAANGFFDDLSNRDLTKLTGFFGSIGTKLSDLKDRLGNMSGVQRLVSVFTKSLKTLKKVFSDLWTNLKKGFSSVGTKIGGIKIEDFNWFFNGLAGAAELAGKGIAVLVRGIQELVEVLKGVDIKGWFNSKISTGKTGFWGFLNKLSPTQISKNLQKTGRDSILKMILQTLGISKDSGSAAAAVGQIENFYGKKGTITEALSGLIENVKRSNIFKFFKEVGDGFQKVVTNVAPWLNKGMAFISGLLSKYFGHAQAINDIIRTIAFIIIAKKAIKMAKGVADMASGFLGGLSKMVDSFGSIGRSIATAITNFGGIFQSISNAINKKANANLFMTIAIGVGIMVAALIAIYKAYQQDPEAVQQSAIILGGLMVAMGLLFLFAAFMAKHTNFQDAKTGAIQAGAFIISLLAFAGAIYLLGKTMEGLKGMSWTEFGSIAGMIAIMITGLLIVLHFVMKETQGVKGVDVFFAMLGIYTFVSSVTKIIDQMVRLSEMPFSKILRGALLLIPIFAAMAGVMTLASKITFGAGFTMFAGIAMFFMLEKLIEKIQDEGMSIDGATIAKVLGVLTVTLLGILGILTLVSRVATNVSVGAGMVIIGFAASVYLMALAISMLSQIDPYRLDSASTAITTIIVVLGLMMSLVLYVTRMISIKNAVASLIVMIGIVGSVLALGIELALLGLLPESVILKGVIALSAIGAVVGALMSVAAKCKSAAQKALLIASVMTGLAVLLAEVYIIANMSDEAYGRVWNVVAILAAISAIVDVMIIVLAKFGPGLLKVAKAMSDGALIFAAKIGGAIAIIGGAVALVIEFVSITIRDLATSIGMLGYSIQSIVDAFNSIGDIDIDKIRSVWSGEGGVKSMLEDMATVIAEMNGVGGSNGTTRHVGASVADAFSGFANSKTFDAAGQIKTMSESLTSLAQGAKDITDSGLTSDQFKSSMTSAAEGFEALATVLKSDEFSKDAGDIGIGLGSMAIGSRSMAEAIASLQGIDSTSLTDICTAIGNAFSSLATALNQADGFGAESRGSAIASLAYSANSLANAVNTLYNIDSEHVDVVQGLMMTLGTTFDEFGKAVGETGFWNDGGQIVDLVNSIGTFATGIQALMDLSGSTEGNSQVIWFMSQLGDTFKQFGDAVSETGFWNNSGGIIDLIGAIGEGGLATSIGDLMAVVGSDRVADFDSIMTTVSTGLNNFATTLQSGGFWDFVGGHLMGGWEDRASTIQSMVQSVSDLVTVIMRLRYLSDEEIFDQFMKMNDALTQFADVVRPFGNDPGLLTSGDNISKLADDLINLLDSMSLYSSSPVEEFSEIGKNCIQSFKDSFKDDAEGESLDSYVVEMIDGALKTIKDTILDKKTEDFNGIGSECIKEIVKGMRKQMPDITGLNGVLAKDFKAVAIKKLNSYYQSFSDSGKYLVIGFANGISLNTYIATHAAAKMAEEAKKAADEALGVNSPSKVFYDIGSYVVQGFANGISENSYLAMDQMTAMSAAIASIGQSVDLQNSDPVIRPVLDLSNVESGVKDMDSMFGPRTLAAGINSSMARRSAQIQNGSNKTITIAPQITINGDYTSEQGAAIARDIDRQLGALL